MSLVSEIKCVKCDRMHSGLRSKCPYCGTRRISRGKYSGDGENFNGKVLIAVLIMSIFVVATGVLLYTTEVEDDPPDEYLMNGNGELDDLEGDDGHVSIPATEPVLPVVEEPEEPEEPEEILIVRSVQVRFGGNRLIRGADGDEFSFNVGQALNLTVHVEPLGIEYVPMWATSDRGIFEVTPTNTENTEVTVRATGRGTGRLTVTVGDVTETVIVRVPR